jgi:multisubunit Na+/H+ antiporter MnhF subunit
MEIFGVSSRTYVVGVGFFLTYSCSLHDAVFQNQAYLLAGLLAYVAIAIYGKYVNSKRANSWYVYVLNLNIGHL